MWKKKLLQKGFRLTIDQDPQALKMGNFLKPYKCLGLGISNYHQLIGVFHLTGCAPSIDPTWQAFQIPAKTPGILGGKRKFLVSHTHKFPWDWYFYLILWFIFMVNLGERYHTVGLFGTYHIMLLFLGVQAWVNLFNQKIHFEVDHTFQPLAPPKPKSIVLRLAFH